MRRGAVLSLLSYRKPKQKFKKLARKFLPRLALGEQLTGGSNGGTNHN